MRWINNQFYSLSCFTFFFFSFSSLGAAPPNGGDRPGKGQKILGLRVPGLKGESLKKLLSRGFLVTGDGAGSMADLYEVRGPRDFLPALVTIDALEDPVFRAVSLVVRASWAREGPSRKRALEKWIQGLLAMGPGPWLEGWKKALEVLGVSLTILAPPGELEDLGLPAGVLRAVRAEEGNFETFQERPSPILGRMVDYGRVPTPGGRIGVLPFFTERWLNTARFKWWLAEAVLLLDRPEQLKAGLLLSATAPVEWKNLNKRDRILAGPLDNLGLGDFQEALKEAGGLKKVKKNPGVLRKILGMLKAKKIPGRCAFQVQRTRGLNLGGSRSSPGIDALVLGSGGRYVHPTGLILAGGVGNSWARKEAGKHRIRYFWGEVWRPDLALGDVDWPGVETCLSVSFSRGGGGCSLFWRFFRILAGEGPGRDGNGEWYWNSPAWKKRKALAALGGWALWRKALGPLGRRGRLVVGGGNPRGGYIVPSREEIQALREFFGLYERIAPHLEILGEPLKRVRSLLKKTAELREKQETGESWSEEDEAFFSGFSRALRLRGDHHPESPEGSGNSFYPCVVQVGDLSVREPGKDSGHPEGKLFSGLATPKRIYAIVRSFGKWMVARGGVLDYREFLVPPGMGFDDRDWAETLRSHPGAGALDVTGEEGFPAKGWRRKIEEAVREKNPALLQAMVLAGGAEKEAEMEFLARILEKERAGCKDRWRVACTSLDLRPPGLKGLLFSFQLVWRGRADPALVPPGRRKDLCRKVALEAGRSGAFPLSFFRELFGRGLDLFQAGLEGYIEGKKKLGAEESGRILLEFLSYPGKGASGPEEQKRRELAGLVVRSGREMMKTLFLKDLSLGWTPPESVMVHKALLWAFCPEGFKLEDWVLEKAPSSLLGALSGLKPVKGVPLPKESLRYFQEKLAGKSIGADSYFGILYFLERNGFFPDPRLWEKGWSLLEKSLSSSDLLRSDPDSVPFYARSVWAFCLALWKPGRFVKRFRSFMESRKDEERTALWELLRRSLSQATDKFRPVLVDPFFSLLCPGEEVWKDLPPPPDIPMEGMKMDWPALEVWLAVLKNRVPMRREE